MNQTIFAFRPGVELVETEDNAGLSLNGRIRMAGDAAQAELIRMIYKEPQTEESLTERLESRKQSGCDPGLSPEADTALELAGLILDFSDYF